MSLTTLPARMNRPMNRADSVLFVVGCTCLLAIVVFLLSLGYRHAEEVVNGKGDGLDRLFDALTMFLVGGTLAVVAGVVSIILFIVGPRWNRYGALVLFSLAAVAGVPPVASSAGALLAPVFIPGAQRRKEERERPWREAMEANQQAARIAAEEANARRARERVKVRDRYHELFAELREPHVVVFHDRDGGYLVLDTGAAVVPSLSGHVEPLASDDMHRLVGRTVRLRLLTKDHFERGYRAPHSMDELDPAGCLAHLDAQHCVERIPVLLDSKP